MEMVPGSDSDKKKIKGTRDDSDSSLQYNLLHGEDNVPGAPADLNSKTSAETPNMFLCNATNCGFRYIQEIDLENHKKRAHRIFKEGAFGGYFCGNKRNTKDSFYQHLLTKHLNELPESCHISGCGFRSAGKPAMSYHQETKHAEEWKAWRLQKGIPVEHKCRHCPKTFISKRLLWGHNRIHSGMKHRTFFTCNTCGKTFRRVHLLKEHLILKHGEPGKTFQCAYSGCKRKPFATEYFLKMHVKSKHVLEEATCQDCGGKYKNQYYLQFHRKHGRTCAKLAGRKIESALISCPQCPLSFPNNRRLNRHVQSVHSSLRRKYKYEGVKGGKKCYFCNFTDTRLGVFYEHMMGKHLCELPMACNVQGCQLRSARRAGLGQHLKKNHEKEWKAWQSAEYKCSVCPMVFKRERLFQVHVLRHNVQNKCGECGKIYIKKSQLMEHLIRRHGYEGATYPCPHKLCKSQPFASKGRLHSHMKSVHPLVAVPCPPKNRYICEKCGEGFGFLKHRGNHMVELHGGIGCQLCPKMFNNWQYFVRHVRGVHDCHSQIHPVFHSRKTNVQ